MNNHQTSIFHSYLSKLVGPAIWERIKKESRLIGIPINDLIESILGDFIKSIEQQREKSIELNSKITVTSIDGDSYQFEDLKAAEEYIKDYGGKIDDFIPGATT